MQAVQTITARAFPSPDELAQYDAIVPGMAERLLASVEKQQDHRMALETKVVGRDIRRADLGLLAGFIFGLLVFGGAVVLILNGHESIGAGAIIADFLVYGGAFLYSDRRRRDERGQKARR